MSPTTHDLAHLTALIEAAKAQSDAGGPELARVGSLLDEALASVRALRERGGKADEGLRPEQLNTENDE